MRNWVLLYMHEKLETLMYISNGQDWSCNQVRIELHATDDTMKLRLPYCVRLRINPLYTTAVEDMTKDFKSQIICNKILKR
jgi:hypothetical protein